MFRMILRGRRDGRQIPSKPFTRNGLRHRLLRTKRMRWVGFSGLGRVSWEIIGGHIKVCDWREF